MERAKVQCNECECLSCPSPATESGMCAEHAADRAANARRNCERCGLEGYPWGVLVPCVQTYPDGRTLCRSCLLGRTREAVCQ